MQIDFTPYKKWVFPHFQYEYRKKYIEGIRYFVDKGGRSSAKSWHKAKKFVKRSFSADTDQIIFQKHLTGANKGTRKLIVQTIKRLGLIDHFEIPKSNYTITNKKTGCVIEFSEFKDEDKIKGAEGFRHYWIDEADQCSYEAFQKIDDTLRSYDDTTGDLTFNPVSPFCWIKTKLIDLVVGDDTCITESYKYYNKIGDEVTIEDYEEYLNDSDLPVIKKVCIGGLWISKERKVAVHHSTYLMNNKLPKNYMEKKDIERLDNFDFWIVNDMGEFGSPEGVVLPNFEIRDFDYSQLDGSSGLDFGWTHPLMLIKSYVSELEKTIYVWGEFGGSKIENESLLEHILKNDYGFVWADSAEPKTINYLKKNGVNIKGVNKSKMTVDEQLKRLQSYKIVSHSENTIFNIQIYLYKYPDNNKKDTPLKENDDGVDALRYSQHSWFMPPTKYQGYRS